MMTPERKKSAPKRYGVFVIHNAFGKVKGRQRSASYSQTFSSVRAATEDMAMPMDRPWKYVRFAVLPLLADEK